MKNPKVAVILSGCGVKDGSEIHESVLALLALNRAGAEILCFAPNISQTQVVNHLTGQVTSEKRNILVEANRIARGKCQDLNDLKIDEIDAFLLPGGYGAAKNLSDFADKGSDCQVYAPLADILQQAHHKKKPIAALCIAPVILAKALGTGILTIGQDENIVSALEKMGAQHQKTTIGQITIDPVNKLVTTPCYMLDIKLSNLAEDIQQVVSALIKMI